MKFESKDQRRPTFEAKGIETIRRDQCALTQKILQNSLVTLFRDGIDAVKAYLFRQWSIILSGRLPVSDFILTGRVRSRYRGGRIGPVQAVLSRRLAEADPAKVVRHKERQSYVIVYVSIKSSLHSLSCCKSVARCQIFEFSQWFSPRHAQCYTRRRLQIERLRLDSVGAP
jgi:DNA polymerase elongation subunit (family B)